MELLIVRHAESEGNATGNYSSAQADALSTRGEQQAVALADTLAGSSFDRIVTSPLQRALQTIAPYLAATDQRAEIWPELAEACWHDEREEISDDWQAQAASLPASVAHRLFAYRDGRAVQPAHPESFGRGLRRVHCALARIREAARRPGGTMLMVTHGHFIRELLNLLLATPAPVAFPHDNCGRTLVRLGEGLTVAFCNRGSARLPPAAGGAAGPFA